MKELIILIMIMTGSFQGDIDKKPTTDICQQELCTEQDG